MASPLEILALTDDEELAAETVRSIVLGPHDGLTELAEASVKQRCVLRVARYLEQHDVDIAQIQVGPSAVASARLPVFLLEMDDEKTVDLGTIRDQLVKHRELLVEVIGDLARAHPASFVVVYGLGLSLSRDEPAERQSSDIDLYIENQDQAILVLDHLVSTRGLEMAGTLMGRGAGQDLSAWKASAETDGHAILVDAFTGGRPSGGHQWIPPFRLPDLFGSATEVHLPGGGVALIPSTEHMLVMLAEKVQRKGDFSIRRISDALALTANGVAWDEVLQRCDDTYVALGLDWIVGQVERMRPGRVPAEVVEASRLAGWERKAQQLMQAPKQATRRRARSMHRRWWVTRYVAGHTHRRQAFVEVTSGRYLKPQRTGFHYSGPGETDPIR